MKKHETKQELEILTYEGRKYINLGLHPIFDLLIVQELNRAFKTLIPSEVLLGGN